MAKQTPPSPDPSLREIIPRPVDWRVFSVLVISALVLTASYYFGHYHKIHNPLAWLLSTCGVDEAGDKLNGVFRSDPRAKLWKLFYWAGAHSTFYMVVPAAIIIFVFREKLSDYGLKLSGWYKRLWIYAGAFAVVLPLVLWMGATKSFQSKYPFYRHAGDSWADFLSWEAAYAVQFFALEFFFRGFMVHGLKHRFGFYSVIIMTVPYCMIHFGKPLPETIGAIIAGIFLGTLSLWTRSIWLGFLIHVSVALCMDLTALGYRGELKNLFGW